jgi:uncharacterized phage protein gp47/JayE
MPDLPTYQDLFNVGRDEMLADNPNLTVEVIETPATETNILTAGAAAVGDECIGQLALTAASLFLDSANGPDLDRLVFDRYGLIRNQAAPATGSVNFYLPSAPASLFTIPANTTLTTQDGRQFFTTGANTWPGGFPGPITAAVRSALAGSNQQAAIGTITSISQPVTTAPAGLTVNNVLATFGAADQETDDSLRNRARTFFTTVVRGTLAAIQQQALTVAGVQSASAFEVLDALGRPAKSVELFITDQFTDSLVSISPTPLSYQAQSNIISEQVYDSLANTRAAGIFVLVQVAQVVIQQIFLGLHYLPGANIANVQIAARSAVAAYINSLDPGTTAASTAVLDALRAVPGLDVLGSEIVSAAPSLDIPPLTLQVLRTSLTYVLAVGQSPDQYLQSNPDSLAT